MIKHDNSEINIKNAIIMITLEKVIFTLLLTISIFAFSSCSEKEKSEPMNVLFIFSDDLNDWNSVLKGHSQTITPNIERLAKKSLVFTNAHCPSPACGPSRAAIMTGLHPTKTKVFTNAGDFRDNPETANAITLPQYFGQHGYYTIAAGKVFHHPRGNDDMPNKLSDDQSWHEQWRGDVGTLSPRPFPEQELDIPTEDYFGKSFVWGPSPEPLEQTGDYQLSKFIGDFVKKDHEKPFFAAAGIFRPHLSWFVPQEFFDLYPLEDIILPKVQESDLDDIPEGGLAFIKPLVHDALKTQGKWKEAVQAYLASTSFADYCLGVLLDALEESKYKDNTIIVLMGDHGWHLGEKEHWSKFTLWERATRTTFMIHVPGQKPGITNAPVSLIDIYPTLNHFCNLPIKNDIDGNSLSPLFKNNNAQWPHAAITYYLDKDSYSIKDEKWRYIHYANNGGEELYNHENDPNEWNNLINEGNYSDIIDILLVKANKSK